MSTQAFNRVRHITLRGDNYGLSPAVDDGILELLQLGRLSAVGCLSQSQRWPAAAQRLEPFRQRLSVGLHLNLTAGLSDDDRPLNRLLLQLLAGRLDHRRISANITHQLDLFEAYWNSPPAFISSHQQVHVLPQLRQLIFSALTQRYAQPPALNDPTCLVTATNSAFKCGLTRRLSAPFRRQAEALSFRLNASFAGIYSATRKADFRRLMNTWVHQQSDNGLIICHPAKCRHHRPDDTSLAAGERELAYLTSSAFADLLECTGVCLQTPKLAAVPNQNITPIASKNTIFS